MPDRRTCEGGGGGGGGPQQNRTPEKVCTVLFDYEGDGEDELTLKRGEKIVLLCEDATISGDDGWWIGQIGEKVGIFPQNFVDVTDGSGDAPNAEDDEDAVDGNNGPPEICFEDIVRGAPIGSGGFGRVYAGTYGNQPVAIKALDAKDPVATCDALKKEGSFFWQLDHENIVHLFGLCNKPPSYWLIMEYCSGGALYKVLVNHHIGLSTLLEWAKQIAEGMKYIHSKDIIHRDLKSTNVLLVTPYDPETGRAVTLKITDFGLARSSVQSTISTRGGTCGWMAPENIRHNKYSWRSDVWSYGVVLWELLTSETPYKEFNDMAIAYGIGTGTLSLHIPDTCPGDFKDLMEACWEPEPHKRPSFTEILERLSEISKSSFMTTPHESFQTMQCNWKKEIEAAAARIIEREKAIGEREEEIRRREDAVQSFWKKLEERDRDITQRELNQARLKEESERCAPLPKKRHGRVCRNLEITPPTDFKHILSWGSQSVLGQPLAFPVSPNLNVGRFSRPRAIPATNHMANAITNSPTTARSPLLAFSGLLNESSDSNLGLITSSCSLRPQGSPIVTRAPLPTPTNQVSACSTPTLNGSQKGKTWGPSTLQQQQAHLKVPGNAGFIELDSHVPRWPGSTVRDQDLNLIVNPGAYPHGDQSICIEGSPVLTPSKEKDARKKNVFGAMKYHCKNFLSTIGLGRDKQNVTLKNHSRSYNELGSGEHMVDGDQSFMSAPRSLDDSPFKGRGTYIHNTYHGQMTQRNSATRPSLIVTDQQFWGQNNFGGQQQSPLTCRRRSSTTSHDSDQAYNSASSGFGPSPLGNATVSTPLQTSDYPYTPSSAELTSAETLCNPHTASSPYELPPRPSYHIPVSSPASSHGSSVFDNPNAAPRSPPRPPQFYARNMSTPNANAYKVHGSPFMVRKLSYPETHSRPSTLNIQPRHFQPSEGRYTPGSTPPEMMDPRFPTLAGSRQPLNLNHDYSSPHQQQQQPYDLFESSGAPSPAPPTPPDGNAPHQRKPTIAELEQEFRI